MKLLKTEEYHEDMGPVLFVSFSRNEDGTILGEIPEFEMLSGYLEVHFDKNKWTHFINDNLNFIFTDADPINFPPMKLQEVSSNVLTIDKCIEYLVKNADKFSEDNNSKFAELFMYLLVTNDDS